MYSEWKFKLSQHEIRITNHWFGGLKLYVNGQLQDTNFNPFALGKNVFLSCNLGELGKLEVTPYAPFFTVEISVRLTTSDDSILIFSTYERQTLREKRLFAELAN